MIRRYLSPAAALARAAIRRNFHVLHPPPTKAISSEGMLFFSVGASCNSFKGPADLYPLILPKQRTRNGSREGIGVGVSRPVRGRWKRNFGNGVGISSSFSRSGGSAESHASLQRTRESTSRPFLSVFSRLSRKKVKIFAPVARLSRTARGKERRESVTRTSGANSRAFLSNQKFPTVTEGMEITSTPYVRRRD